MNSNDQLAFPNEATYHPGMTLRDYFAAAALSEVMNWKRATAAGYQVTTEECAKLAYQIADAMLSEKNKL